MSKIDKSLTIPEILDAVSAWVEAGMQSPAPKNVTVKDLPNATVIRIKVSKRGETTGPKGRKSDAPPPSPAAA